MKIMTRTVGSPPAGPLSFPFTYREMTNMEGVYQTTNRPDLYFVSCGWGRHPILIADGSPIVVNPGDWDHLRFRRLQGQATIEVRLDV